MVTGVSVVPVWRWRVVVLATPVFPITQAKPDERAAASDEQRPDDLEVAVSEQVPSHHTDEDADTFGRRERRARR